MSHRDLADEPSFAVEGLFEQRAPGAPPGSPVSGITLGLLSRLEAWRDPHESVRRGAAPAARGPLPLHPERIDPTWYWTTPTGGLPTLTRAARTALGALGEPLRTAVCRVAALSPESGPLSAPRALLEAAARQQWGHLADMPGALLWEAAGLTEATPRAALARTLARLPAAVLHGAVLRAGAAGLGILLRHLPDRAAAGICGRLPQTLREEAWSARRGDGPAAELGAPTRQDLLRLQATPGVADTALLVFTLGARPVAAFLRHHAPLTLRQVAQGLPVPVGQILLDTPVVAPPPTHFVIDCLVRAAAG